ncbi:hypothetical protein OIO90_005593 [Microbotryomycetes sp. JL221]|nr:hypothetical protein OIO90_005593 [Microbotryomycetes sp. JL221]
MSNSQGASPVTEKAPAGFWGRPGSSNSRSNSQVRSNSTGGLWSGLGLAQPSLKIDFAEEVLYLFPKPGVPTYDPYVEGTVTLYLPKARSLRNLTVKLWGRVDLGWVNKPYEAYTVLEKSIELVSDDKDIHLEKGEHVFAFSFLVPSNAAPYERCQYGRTRHFVSARAPGLGNLGGDVTSNEKELYLIPGAMSDRSEPPPPLQYKMEGADDALGPWTASLQSGHIMVGGLLQLRLQLVSPPQDVAIHSVRVKVTQHAVLKTPPNRQPPYMETPPPEHRTVCLLDLQHPPNMGNILESTSGTRSGSQTPRHGPLTVLSPGEEWKISHIMRFLNDNIIRATTQPGTETCINLRHDIAIEIVYQLIDVEEVDGRSESRSRDRKGKSRERERKMFIISKPLEIWSCCCWLDSLTLPPYQEKDPNPERPDGEIPCMCGFPISLILKHHGASLLHDEDNSAALTYAQQPKPHQNGPSERRGRTSTRGESTDPEPST